MNEPASTETCPHENDSNIGNDTRWCADCGALSVVTKTVPETVWSAWSIPNRIVALEAKAAALDDAHRVIEDAVAYAFNTRPFSNEDDQFWETWVPLATDALASIDSRLKGATDATV